MDTVKHRLSNTLFRLVIMVVAPPSIQEDLSMVSEDFHCLKSA